MSIVSTSAINFLRNSPIWLWCGIIGTSLGLVISTLSYTKIFFTLCHRQPQVHEHVQQPNQTNQLNITRHKKAVSTALWLQLALAVCYLPYVILITWITQNELSSTVCIAFCYTLTLAYLNSTLNPILYCWKIDEVKQVVKGTIRQVLCC